MSQGFAELVWAATKKIPRGRVATYHQVAIMIKRPAAARAVGNALHKNPYAPLVPCHRVIRSDGMVGGFAGGSQRKIALLKKEGITIRAGRVVDLKKFLI